MDSTSFNYIESEEFLVNIFLELLKKKKYNINLDDLFKLEYYYLEILSDENINIINNSKEKMINFMKQYDGYLYIEKIDKGELEPKFIICIVNPEDFETLLTSKYLLNEDEHKEYKKAVKQYINKEKMIA